MGQEHKDEIIIRELVRKDSDFKTILHFAFFILHFEISIVYRSPTEQFVMQSKQSVPRSQVSSTQRPHFST